VTSLFSDSFSVKTRKARGFHRPDDYNTNLEYLTRKGVKEGVVASFNSPSRK
jgi:hypothetical protein